LRLVDGSQFSDCTAPAHNQNPLASFHSIQQGGWIVCHFLWTDVGHFVSLPARLMCVAWCPRLRLHEQHHIVDAEVWLRD
jgi:hypothetical protein